MKYVILAVVALVHTILIDLGSMPESLQWLWNGLAFGVVWATAIEVGARYGS